jgi:signal transduction histidine kinase
LATGLAHEIHNPLSAMRMHAQLLASTPPEDPAAVAAESIPVFLEEAGRIESLVNQWMFLARPIPPQTAPADLGVLVTAVLRTRAATAAHAGVRLEEAVPLGLLARVDGRRLTQALGNVVLNAIQAMPLGGTLRVEGRAEAGLARLFFTDSGPGFSEAALARHAELFFSEKEGGMGIGLNVCAEILKAHGGALRVANGSGGGAVATLELPIYLPS